MTYAVDLSNLALEANGAAAGITANATVITAISVGNSTVNTSITTGVALTATATAAYTPQIVLNNLANDATGAFFTLTKSRSGGASLSSDSLGTLYFNGTNTANGLTYAAAITAIQTSSANATATPAALGFNVLGGVEKMRITAGGLVGIGTSSPSALLDVTGSLGAVRVNTNGDQIDYTFNGFNYLTASGAAASLQIQASGASGKLIFATAAVERMRISSNGNVGIGNSTPGSSLVVSGAITTGNTDLGNNQVATVAFAIAVAYTL